MKPLKVLNLYAGIGGNRKLWEDVEVTAVEYDPKIAAIYKDFFPNDTVIVADAHQYLLDHYKEYSDGFIWGSPPCPTHSGVNNFLNPHGVVRYPAMELWQDIIFLEHFCKGKYCIENVKSYYEPFLKPQISGRHYVWANFKIPNIKVKTNVSTMGSKRDNRVCELKEDAPFKIPGLKFSDNSKNLYRKVINNCCHPEIGLCILNAARNIIIENKTEPGKLF